MTARIRRAWCGVFRTGAESWTFINLSLRLASRVVVLMVLVRNLSTTSLALWYVFSALFGLATLAEAGMAKVATRHVALRLETPDIDGELRLVMFLRASAVAYLVLVAAVCATGAATGMVWLAHTQTASMVKELYLPWALFVVGGGIALLGGFCGAVLCGLHRVDKAQQNEAAACLVHLAAVFLMVTLTHSVLLPILAILASSAFALFMHLRALRVSIPMLFARRSGGSPPNVRSATAELLPDMGRMLLIMAAYQLLTSVFIILLGTFGTATEVAAYGLTMQLISVVLTIANTWLTAAFPRLCVADVHGEDRLRRLFFSAAWRGTSVVAVGFAAIFLWGPYLLALIGSRTSLLAATALAVLLVAAASEQLLGFFAQLLISQGKLRVAYFSLAGAILIVAMAWFMFNTKADLTEIFGMRFFVYFVAIGVPILLLVRPCLTPRCGAAR